MPTTRAVPSIRSLADDVRARSDADLAALVLARTDLARPSPADLTSLAARASTRASVQRALDALDRGHLLVLEAALVSGDPIDVGATAALLGSTPAGVRPLLDHLWSLALVWREEPVGRSRVQHVARPVVELLMPFVAGLAPADPLRTPMTPEDVARALEGATAHARNILERLSWGPPVGRLNSSQAAPSSAPTSAPSDGPPDGSTSVGAAAAWLLARGLLVPGFEPGDVVLPRDVALALRGGRLHREASLTPPDLAATSLPSATVQAATGASAGEILGYVDELAALWGPQPPPVLRTGGLGVREFTRLARQLELPADKAAFVVELAYGAGLIEDDGGLEPVWAPTALYDEWERLPTASRWLRLATTWLSGTRAAFRVGARDEGDSAAREQVRALSEDASWPRVRAFRLEVLGLLDGLPDGAAPDPAAVVRGMSWARPSRHPRLIDEVTRAVLHEAEWLGVTGRGALGAAGRALLHAQLAGVPAEEAAALMDTHVPAAVTHVLLQADLTAVAPGRLDPSLAQLMRLTADVESRGGANVYRFSEASVRRPLDAGWSADQLLAALADASSTPVPQPLAYLVGDVARRHGQTRVGSCSTYLRSDDPGLLDTMVATRALSSLRLRRLAPTVVVSPANPAVVVDTLAQHGFAPVAEGEDGGVVVRRPGAHRAGVRRRTPPRPLPPAGLSPLIDGLIASMRAGERSREASIEAADASGPPLTASDPSVTLALVRDAIADRQSVWIGVADAHGAPTRYLLHPTRVDGGRVHGTVEGSSQPVSYSVHRITGAALTL